MKEPKAIAVGLKEAGRIVGLSQWTLRRYVGQGLLPAVRFGRRILIRMEKLDEFVRMAPGLGRKKID